MTYQDTRLVGAVMAIGGIVSGEFSILLVGIGVLGVAAGIAFGRRIWS